MIYDCDGKYESIRNVLDYKIDRLLSRTQNLCAMEVIDEITKIEYLF